MSDEPEETIDASPTEPDGRIDASSAEGAGSGGSFDLPRAGDIVGGRYEVSSMIGSGGMGHVFEAKHTTLGRRVALKVLAPERSHKERHVRRFLREAKSASAIVHPCVVEITDFGHTASGSPFFVMEYLEGETLGRCLRRSGPMPWSLLAPIAMQVCGALDAAHAAGVIHRDIKPENLFILQQTTHVKVVDFGIAKPITQEETKKLTEAGTVLGTVDYVSPEVIRDETVDPRTDIYSLGVTLYQLISGELPFVRDSKLESMLCRLHDPPAPLPSTVPAPVAEIIERAIRAHPYERFQTARELYDAIVEQLPERGPAVHDAISRAKLSSSTMASMSSMSAPRDSTLAGESLPAAQTPPRDRSRRPWLWPALGGVGAAVAVAVAVIPRSNHSSTIDAQHLASFGALPEVISGPGISLDDARIELGRVLFSDVALSGAGDLSCATCHPLDRYGVDGRVVADGHAHKTTGRNVSSVYNAAGHFALGWSGSATTVEAQAQIPILEPRAMANTEVALLETLGRTPRYRELFGAAFPTEPDPIRLDNVGIAIGAFERTLVTPAPWDHYLAGDTSALSTQQRRGFNTFVDVGCVQCHSGVYLGAGQLQKLGLLRPWPDTKDRGRLEDTQQDSDWMMFKIASLRNVEKTGPYFHDGSIEQLPRAVRMMAHHQLDQELDDEEVEDIVAFLRALTGELPSVP